MAASNSLPTSRKQQLKQRVLLDEIQKNVPRQVSAAIAREAINSQIVRKSKSYYSTVRFQFTPTTNPQNPNEVTYSLKGGTKLRAFSYGLGDTMESAGFSKDFGVSTEADTNLISKGDTNGAVVKIVGVSLYLAETSDARLTKLVWANTYVDTTLDGVKEYMLIGRMGRIPAAGGLYGSGDSAIVTPSLTANSAQVGAFTNGIPQSTNFLRLGEPIWWHSAGKTDSKFQVRFMVARDMSWTTTARPASPGVEAFSPPTKPGDDGTYVDVVTYLQTWEYKKRSKQE